MENNRFLLDSDYLEIITKEALEQIIQPGNEYKFIQAEELAEMSILENLVENYEIENELMKGKAIRMYDRRINYPVGAYIQYEDNIYKVIRSISGYKVPTDKIYWEESIEIQELINADPYSQLLTYRPGDLVCYNGIVFECMIENGYEFNDIRVPLSNCWEKAEPLKWTPTPFQLYDPVSYGDNFYQLYELTDYDETISPDLRPQCWGEILPYDPNYNEYELSPHEFVVYDGKVFYPTLNVNSDIPEIGKNLALEDPRHKNIKKHMVRLALYELTKNISPNNVSITRSNDYETSMAWLKDANRLKINPMIPRKVDNTGKPTTDWGIAYFSEVIRSLLESLAGVT